MGANHHLTYCNSFAHHVLINEFIFALSDLKKSLKKNNCTPVFSYHSFRTHEKFVTCFIEFFFQRETYMWCMIAFNSPRQF